MDCGSILGCLDICRQYNYVEVVKINPSVMCVENVEMLTDLMVLLPTSEITTSGRGYGP